MELSNRTAGGRPFPEWSEALPVAAAAVRTAFLALSPTALLLSLCLALPEVSQAQTPTADIDGDGLIEIASLDQLNAMRYDLDGNGTPAGPDDDQAVYRRAFGLADGVDNHCPAVVCRGYELRRDLDFDTDGDGTWSGEAGDYLLDEDDSRAPYFEVNSDGTGGWRPIGGSRNPFVAVFDGNGYRIRHLAIRRDTAYVGFFGVIGSGAAIRNLGLIDNLADYTGSGDYVVNIGGLAGYQTGGSITASYATGPADGGSGNMDFVGGLVGYHLLGSITASYATGPADGGAGNIDRVGGLVGLQEGSSITASYATGAADGGDGGGDLVGGLVGFLDGNGGSITASYATGAADGGGGANDQVGGLVGQQRRGSSTASYGFGVATGGITGLDGSPPVKTAAQLTLMNAGDLWNTDTVATTLGAWDFGTDEQLPALNYADYDGAGAVFDCDQFPVDACGTLLPGQDAASAGGPSAVEFGDTAELIGSLRFDRVTVASWSWRQLSGPEVALSGADGPRASFLAPLTRERLMLEFELIVTDSEGHRYSDRLSVAVESIDRVDSDGDGLIEIHSLTMLHNMRYNLEGTSYRSGPGSFANRFGCPADLCRGYELEAHLDFDGDEDGATWSGNSDEGYVLDLGDSQADYFPVDEEGAGGWRPIGDNDNPFVAVFEGNGYRLSNLAIRTDTTDVGFFGVIGSGAVIRNLGLIDNLADYTGSSNNENNIGGLVGRQNGGVITASHATGAADGGDGSLDRVGGLVGRQNGVITASYATGAADGGDGEIDTVGGLVGWQFGGVITASYATGAADGGDGTFDAVGGLVGDQLGGSITASYATGDADGGDGNLDRVGGLVGYLNGGSITASYATGAADGGDGDEDLVGGLVGSGRKGSSITASYATGAADGGDGDLDSVGGLVGNATETITVSSYGSYGFGEAIGHERPVGPDGPGPDGPGPPSQGSAKPAGVSSAAQLSAANAGSAWNAADSQTLGAWDFGDEIQVPALNYADYDGAGVAFNCDRFPAGACGTLLPGQEAQAEASAGGPSSAVEVGETVRLLGSLGFGRVPIRSWSWRQLEGLEVALSDGSARETAFRVLSASTRLRFELTATGVDGRRYSDSIAVRVKADRDGDGLIELYSLVGLHNMRYNLEGTGYRDRAASAGNSDGCPDGGCRGYELMGPLNFDGDGDGRTWSANADGSYSLDAADSRDDYFPVENGAGGWQPIGDDNSPFAAVFEGNSHTISNLAIRMETVYVGFFGAIGSGAAIRHLGLVDNLADYTGSGDEEIFIGGLVGRQETGTISLSYATGPADGGGGDLDSVGGLVGFLNGGSIRASHARGVAAGGDGDDSVGGLVGRADGSALIRASYATGAAAGGGDDDSVGGLVGRAQGSALVTASYARGAVAGGGDDDSVGGLVGRADGSALITASYATGAADGGDGDMDSVGGLVGFLNGGSIRASHARGAAAGGDGDDSVGGLVGRAQGSALITASYTRGAADGGDGGQDAVGGLVGLLDGSSITASYARGAAAGGDGDDSVGGLVGRAQGSALITAGYARGAAAGGGDDDSVGGLVGRAQGSATIRASYATGAADGGGGEDAVGGLTGMQNVDLIMASYGFGVATGEIAGSDGSPPVGAAAQLRLMNAGGIWNTDTLAATLGAWSFDDGSQVPPVLNYADYDGAGPVFDCSQFPVAACGAPIPGQAYVSASGPSEVEPGQEVRLVGTLEAGRVTIVSWSWQRLAGAEVSLSDAGAREASFTAPRSRQPLVFRLSATDSEGRHYSDLISLAVAGLRADNDGDGLIEVYNLIDLHNMRYNLAGTSYRSGPASAGDSSGCPEEGGCLGYELMEHLDFDTDGDGTWSGDSEGGYRLDPDDRHPDYFPVNENGAGGWQPIGDRFNPFAAVFEGNGYRLSNLAIRTDTTDVGFFGVIGSGAAIRNLGLIDNLADYTGSSDEEIFIGGLVGRQNGGVITASYVSGAVAGGEGAGDRVGGLVGSQEGGSITASYAGGAVAGGEGAGDRVGGLVGSQEGGSITASYAGGAVAGGEGNEDRVGGLVGSQDGGLIMASYASGAADGGDGELDSVGGLVGRQDSGLITESYATGAVAGGEGNEDRVGGLAGVQSGEGLIRASYATGAAAGGDGRGGRVGGLVGSQDGGLITASYARGAAAGGEDSDDRVGGLVGSQEGGSITASYARGAAAGGGGDGDQVGGLAGVQSGEGLITASYALGAADGGEGDEDQVGGLVGRQSGGSIRASYARGAAAGGNGVADRVGGLVGDRKGTVIESYGFGGADGENQGSDGSAHPPVSTATELTAINAGDYWKTDTVATTLGAWDFGTDEQIPALNYADYDGGGAVFDCGQLPACGTLLPGQDAVIAAGPRTVAPGETVDLRGSLEFGRVRIASWSWQQLEGPEVPLGNAGARATNFAAPGAREPLVFELSATDSEGRRYSDRIVLSVETPADRDGDGLIELYSLTDLHNMRYDLAGTSYSTGTASAGDSSGCPEGGGCFGYELMEHLDFDTDGDGTWSDNADGSYSLDADDGRDDYFSVENGAGGWQPIGDESAPFVAVFDGAGHGIRHLAIRTAATVYVGLFGVIAEEAAIRSLGLIDSLADYTGSSAAAFIGGLVGRQSSGSITASYVTGAVAGGEGAGDRVGGLVGSQEGGSITASYATGAVAGGEGAADRVGGLVGVQSGESLITASYATGAAAGGGGAEDQVGGLVGRQSGGSIRASYATGAAAGGEGGGDQVGGLLGVQSSGAVTASYGFGRVEGETEGYGTSTLIVPGAAQLTGSSAGSAWNSADSHTLGAWDFGTDKQVPALNYADYDGAGPVFDCSHFPLRACGTLVPGQRDPEGGGGAGGGRGGGGGSMGPWGLVVLALPLLLGWRRRRPCPRSSPLPAPECRRILTSAAAVVASSAS